MKYQHAAIAIFSTPWAIRPEKLHAIVELIRFRAEGGMLTPEEVRARIGAGPRREPEARPAGNGVAILPYLEGVIMKRAGALEQTSGAMSLEAWMQDFRLAMADEEVGTIIMPIDSPGGSVDGVPEAAAEIRAARDEKRIVAIADGMAASAAYWLGSQATELNVVPSGSAGSIGVYTAHQDLSGFYEQKGIKTTLISAGKYKVEGNEFEALTEEAAAHAESVVGDYYGMFVEGVAKGRGVTATDVRNGFGEGRQLLAKHAKAGGLVDRIDTVDGILRREIAAPRRRPAAQRALGPAWEYIGGDASSAGAFAEVDKLTDPLPDMEGIEAPVDGSLTELVVDDPNLPEAPLLDPEPDAKAPSFEFELELRRRRAAAHA